MEQLHRCHLAVVVWIMAVRLSECREKRRPRGYEAQRERREVERMVRIRAIELAAHLKEQGYDRVRSASCIGVSVSTMSSWRRQWQTDHLEPKPRGRPVQLLGSELARRITAMLHLLGPFEGLPVLQSLFPDVPRRELEERLRCYRAEYVRENHVVVHTLVWKRPGAVWAMDFAEPPVPIDGIYRYVLSVRDLASGKSLLWLPVERKTGRATHDALVSLFLQYGVPLVIKEDNDGAFRTEEMQQLLNACRAVFLFSPPYTPEYNGACEAGIGTLKTYSHHEAARHNRPGEWTCDDVEAARRRSNELSRPCGIDGPTPNEIWREHAKVSPGERRLFNERLEQKRKQLVDEATEEKQSELNEIDRAVIERRAVAQALIACGLLLVRRRRISPPIKSKFWSRIK